MAAEERPLTNHRTYQSNISFLWIHFLSASNPMCASILGWKMSQQTSTVHMDEIWSGWRWTQKRTWLQGGSLSSYLAALEPGWGCPLSGRWLFELLLFAAPDPGRLSPLNGQVVYPVSSPVFVSLECDRTPLSGPLSPIPVEPTEQRKANHVKTLLHI